MPFTDGTTKNQGLTNIDVVDYGTFVYDQGKLGKCRSFVGNGYLQLSNAFGIELGKDFSCCYWIKEISNNILSQFRVVYQCGNLIIGHYGDKFNIYNSVSSNALDLAYNCDTTEWVHCCMTYQSSSNTVTIYINGVKCSTSQPKNLTGLSDTTALIGKRSSGTYLFEGYLNDFRIYNTCLSPRQVKEISKGLVCHYSLGEVDGKIGGRNLLQHSSLVGEQLICYTIDSMNSVTTKSYEEEGYHIVTPSTGNGNNGVGFKYTDFTSLGIKQGDTIAFSCDIRGTSDTHSPFIKIHFSAKAASHVWWGVDSVNSVGVGFIPLKNKWQRISVTYTIPDTSEWTSNNMWLAIHGNFESDLYIKNLKLEKSSTATPWTPAHEDDSSFYDNVIYDTSGYCNNGSVSGDILWDTNTPRYKGAYDFNGTGYIYNDNLNLTTTAFTISFWIKIPSAITHQHFDFATFNSWTSEGIGIYWDTSGQKISSGLIFGKDSNGDKILVEVQCRGKLNEWTHFAITWDGTNVYRYSNGIKFSESDFKVISVYHPRLWLGNSTFGNRTLENSESCMSDFRFYSTALSDADILDLYQASASVDNNGNLMLAGEVIEE